LIELEDRRLPSRPKKIATRTPFKELDAALPRAAPDDGRRTGENPLEMRIMDLIAPIGKRPARPDRRSTPHRQDDPDAEDRQLDRHEQRPKCT
jgi:hypothetical protein